MIFTAIFINFLCFSATFYIARSFSFAYNRDTGWRQLKNQVLKNIYNEVL